MNDYEYHNVQPIQVPTKEGWKIFYLTKEDIKENEELSVDYG